MSIQSVEAAARHYAESYQALKDEVRKAQIAGVPDAKIARAAGVSRATIYNWSKEPRKD